METEFNSITYTYSVKPLQGVWEVDYSWIESERHNLNIHWYNQRDPKWIDINSPEGRKLVEFEPRLKQKNSNKVYSIKDNRGNATCSYVLDLRKLNEVIREL
ncbi:hypothetical protein [Natranaerofaba carboxydovora]|uniref:hypothetical protein n=1 Tax=Natranaerofaba carboxydovora TaxID=2742683 RepID=UPI001F136D4B|nr:hypothetical protein [Natranaerofaba carboxydovora]